VDSDQFWPLPGGDALRSIGARCMPAFQSDPGILNLEVNEP
jgi:hypothetical protein